MENLATREEGEEGGVEGRTFAALLVSVLVLGAAHHSMLIERQKAASLRLESPHRQSESRRGRGCGDEHGQERGGDDGNTAETPRRGGHERSYQHQKQIGFEK